MDIFHFIFRLSLLDPQMQSLRNRAAIAVALRSRVEQNQPKFERTLFMLFFLILYYFHPEIATFGPERRFHFFNPKPCPAFSDISKMFKHPATGFSKLNLFFRRSRDPSCGNQIHYLRVNTNSHQAYADYRRQFSLLVKMFML